MKSQIIIWNARLRAVIGVAIATTCLFGGSISANAAVLGLDREAYGVWDRGGWHTASEYPFLRGQEYDAEWTEINSARSNFNWTAMDALLKHADEQNQGFFAKIHPYAGTYQTFPPWIFNAGVPKLTANYAYYLDPEYKLYFEEMVNAYAKHLRQDVPPHLQKRIKFVRCATGAYGDESPYKGTTVADQYQIEEHGEPWREFRLWAFEVYRKAFQEGPGPVIPLLFQRVTPETNPIEHNWLMANVTGGIGVKLAGEVRGHHLNDSQSVIIDWRHLIVDSNTKFFSGNEMDKTWEKAYFQLNINLGMYWCAVEQLHAGLTVWDVDKKCVERTYIDGYKFAFDFFNEWAAELVPATARGGFSIFHEGLDSENRVKFPNNFNGSGSVSKSNTARYTAICAAYASQGAQMDDLAGATMGQVEQRNDGLTGFNDAGWGIIPGNYERFITQINPDNTSKALWRVRGTLTTSSHPFDRFARRFDSASGKNLMYFDVHNALTPTPGQRIQLSVIYLDQGTGTFGLLYDAVGNNQKSAFTVTKNNSNTWKTNSVIVTDWVFGNNGPSGADLMLASLDSNDDIFHSIELVKLVNVTMNTIGQGSVSARTDGTVYSSPITGTYAVGQRLEMKVTPASGWKFAGWSGDLSGTFTNAILFPTNENTQVTATFTNANINVPIVITTPDSGTWIVPAGVYSATFQAWGGGGAGGSAYSGNATANTQARGGGGAGSSYAGVTVTVTPGQIINYTNGAGGVGAAAGFAHNSYGATGGISVIRLNGNNIVSARGGPGGQNISVTNAIVSGSGGVAPQTGNTGSNLFYGGSGATGNSSGTGSGGGSAGSLANGTNAPSPTAGGAGGSGGGAAGGAGHNSTALGNAGGAPGAGGSGAGVRNNTPFDANNLHQTGGKGGDGKIIVTYNTLPFTLTTNAVNGSITLSPPGGIYTTGIIVTNTATPNPGYSFSGWSGNLTGSTNPATILIDGNKTITATFTLKPLVAAIKPIVAGSGVEVSATNLESSWTYELQAKTALTSPWTNVSGSIRSNSTVATWTNIHSPAEPTKFFQVIKRD